MKHWKESSQLASHWQPIKGDRVQCDLCPRHCKTSPGQFGFCKVRGNVDGSFHTFNYGKSVAATEEIIETEAVYHFSPGAPILSLGNIGCMFACDFCQNWQTSQIKHLNPNVVQHYTPEKVVQIALENNIKILSWTYNDPVVWHEFVMDTARLGRKHGLLNLYKSAFYINEKPVEELIEVMDIFSLSLKSMDEEFYRKIAKGKLQPMLDRVEQVHASGKHLEISQLVITGRNEADEDFQKTIDWTLNKLGDSVPLHFVGFHPAYKYTNVDRTSVKVLERARELALKSGIKYCYLGNVYEEGQSDTHCASCSELLVKRFGLTADVVGITADNKCKKCGEASPIIQALDNQKVEIKKPVSINFSKERVHDWDEEVKSIHIVAPTNSESTIQVEVMHLPSKAVQNYNLGKEGLSRVIVSRNETDSTGIKVSWDKETPLQLMPILDRAHFPTSEVVEETR